MSSTPDLLLFDIDGTLLRAAANAHRDALLAALARVHGPVGAWDDHRVDTGGRTDPEIARLILLGAGVSAERIDARMPEVRALACEEYARRAEADLSHTVVAGMAELLAALEGHATLSLVTGNLEPIARLKLERAGIGHHFPAGQGGFGSDSESRAALPGVARRRAGHAVGADAPWPRERTVVIGDTPRDVACARADGVRCFAVTTGPHGAEDLEHADAVCHDAGELAAALGL